MIRRNNEYTINREEADRRQAEHRRYIYDYQEPITIERVQDTSESSSNNKGFKLLSSSTMIGICFSIITGVGGFVLKLYDKTNDLEYKYTTMVEKMDDNKKVFADLNNLMKELEKSLTKTNEHMSSMEQTIMELYRSQDRNQGKK
jgi:hypothetical protein